MRLHILILQQYQPSFFYLALSHFKNAKFLSNQAIHGRLKYAYGRGCFWRLEGLQAEVTCASLQLPPPTTDTR